MANGKVVKAWADETTAFLAVAVDEGGKDANGNPAVTEYIGTAPLLDEKGEPLTGKQLKDALVANIKAQRDGQRKAAPPTLNITGTVTL